MGKPSEQAWRQLYDWSTVQVKDEMISRASAQAP
jgi:hypothetical protein